MKTLLKSIWTTLQSWKAIKKDNWQYHAIVLPIAFIMNLYGHYLDVRQLNWFTEFFNSFYKMPMVDRFIHQLTIGFFIAIGWEMSQGLYLTIVRGKKSTYADFIASARDVIVTTALYFIGAGIGILMFPS